MDGHLDLLFCLECGGDLSFDSSSSSVLCRDCSASYEVEDGIIKMPGGQSADSDEANAKFCEQLARDEQADDYDRMLGLRLFGLLEVPWTRRLSDLNHNDTLVEVGCGTGRMTVKFAPLVSRVIAIDFSLQSLQRCRAKLERAAITNAVLVQADATNIPVKSIVADRVLSCQVLEHLPTPSARERMVAELGRVCKQSGQVVLSAYKHSIITKLIGRKEGEHGGGIYYYRFAKHELRELLERNLKIESMSGALVYHYLVKCSVQ